ncbi:MAG: enoyl-CoA hydratase/isomerase family protein [Acetobacteraceae bacterium]|nr:enoyl-CoA hydratase/isomerase family protein [Acetobacteraceae bacterium]
MPNPDLTDPALILAADGRIATITFNRPAQLNALNVAMAEAFEAAVTQLADKPDLRVIVLRGAGRGFMAGGDLGQIQRAMTEGPALVDAIMQPLHRALVRLTEMPQPVIAALHGPVAGAGMSVAMAADLAIAADDAKFTLAYARIGASIDGSGSYHLPRLVGLRKALEIALLADTVDAAEAQRLGLVNFVVPAGELAERTAALAGRLEVGPTLAYGRIKRLLRDSLGRGLPGQLEAERAAFHASLATEDFAEGVAAFLGKRKANYVGR